MPTMLGFAYECNPKGEFLMLNSNLSDYSWITEPPPSYSVNDYTYIASDAGYRFSYHGETKVSFPASNQWGALLESKRDDNAEMRHRFTMKPIRNKMAMTRTSVTNPAELDEYSWYFLNNPLSGDLYAGDQKQRWSKLWALIPPERDFKYSTTQYGLYSLGGGGHVVTRGLRNLDDSRGDGEAVWDFSNLGGSHTFSLTNYRFRDRSHPGEKNFPNVIGHRDFPRNNHAQYKKRDKNDNSYVNLNIQPRHDDGTVQGVSFNEVGFPPFYPVRWYYIESSDGKKVKDRDGNDRWRIIQEKTFYKVISSGGYYLQAQHVDETVIFGSSYRTHNVRVDQKNYPADKWSDPNDYYRSVWAVIPLADNSEWHFIKNARYPSCFLTIDKGNTILRETSHGDQLKIIEAK